MTSSRRRGDRERWRQVAAARQGRTLARSRARREASRARQQAGREHSRQLREIALVDLIDRLLDGGVVFHGDITLAVADVDLLYVGLRALVVHHVQQLPRVGRLHGHAVAARHVEDRLLLA